MSMRVAAIIPAGVMSGSDNAAEIRIICDTQADLPSGLYFVSGWEAQLGSTAHVVSDSTNWEMQSDGTWVQAAAAGMGNYYTKSETDALLQPISDAADAAQQAADDAQDDIDDVKSGSLTELINTGGKNRCPTSGGSNVLPTRWLQIPIVLDPGQYVVKIGSLSSDDTDAGTCQFVCFASDNTVASNYLYLSRGSDVSGNITISNQTAYLRLYPSDSYAHSENDTVTASDIMICSKSDYDISPDYVPYCPTLAELYALVRSYHP